MLVFDNDIKHIPAKQKRGNVLKIHSVGSCEPVGLHTDDRTWQFLGRVVTNIRINLTKKCHDYDG